MPCKHLLRSGIVCRARLPCEFVRGCGFCDLHLLGWLFDDRGPVCAVSCEYVLRGWSQVRLSIWIGLACRIAEPRFLLVLAWIVQPAGIVPGLPSWFVLRWRLRHVQHDEVRLSSWQFLCIGRVGSDGM